MGVAFSQLFPPAPTMTEENLPSQKGKVFIVTGGYSGIGYELSKILYQAGGKVYIAGHTESTALKAIEEIKSSVDNISQAGRLEYLFLELDDLTTIKASVEVFKSKESRLDVLWNNAAVSQPPIGSVSKQGIELQLAVNVLGPYLFTQLLLPCLQETSKTSPHGSVRIIWTSSQMVDLSAPKEGIDMKLLTVPSTSQPTQYTATKTGNWFLASQFAREQGHRGILSVTQNPGNLSTQLLRHMPRLVVMMTRPLLYPAIYGAYTELYAGLSPDITMDMNGYYIVPWGRVHPAPRKDLLEAMKSIEEGGTGKAAEFRDWCEKTTVEFM